MSPTLALLCTDGSDLATHAIAAGLGVLAPGGRVVVATVVEPVDVSLVAGVSGFGGGVMSQEELDRDVAAQQAHAEGLLQEAVATLGLDGAETRVVEGDPGQALCDLATDLGAGVVVIGSRGRGGLKRAVLGSVSDHVVRHAPCPVVVTHPAG